MGDRYFPDYGRCLLIRPETTELTVIPQQKSGWPITTVQETFMVHGRKEPAEMTVHTRAEGLDADRLRAAFADVGRNELEKRYLNFYARDYPKIKTTKPLEVLDHSEQNIFETFEHYQFQEFGRCRMITASINANFIPGLSSTSWMNPLRRCGQCLWLLGIPGTKSSKPR